MSLYPYDNRNSDTESGLQWLEDAVDSYIVAAGKALRQLWQWVFGQPD